MRRKERERELHPQPNPNPNPNASSINGEDDDGGSRKRRIMAKLRDSIISKLNPSLSVVDSSAIERRLRELFRGFDFHTPTHPPYALMIRTAITGLKEEGGFTEETISEFIKKEYRDLPWAHRSILGVQLRKLCEDGELARAEDGRYILSDNIETKQQCRNKKKKREDKGIEQEHEQGEQQLQPYSKSVEEYEKEGLSKCIPITGIVIELPVGHLDNDNQIFLKHKPPAVLRYGKVYRRRRSSVGSKPEPLHLQRGHDCRYLQQNHK